MNKISRRIGDVTHTQNLITLISYIKYYLSAYKIGTEYLLEHDGPERILIYKTTLFNQNELAIASECMAKYCLNVHFC